jgi:hypothetical protein
MQKELIGYYCKDYDTTFIMEATFEGGMQKSIECVGWYHGEPNDADNKEFARAGMKAED